MSSVPSEKTAAAPSGARAAGEGRSDVVVAVERLHKEYRIHHQPVPVLKGVSLEVRRGELLAILGHSGVGKTTLLNLMGLLDSASSGRIVYQGRHDRFRGRDLASLSLADKAWVRNHLFGFIFQFYHLLPDLDVRENVLLPSMIRLGGREFRSQRPALERRADELLERVGIGHRRDFPPNRLSGGERQRAAIARALFNEPEVVYCDEPTGNLDTRTGEKIQELMFELNRSTGSSFVIVTHDEDLARLAHRRLLMVDGVFESAPRA